MLDAIYASGSGLIANQTRLEVLSNNIANINTPAFKKGRTRFVDVAYRNLAVQGDPNQLAQVGLGTAVSGVQSDFAQGDLRQTDRSLDVTIQGNGFFEVKVNESELAYTRIGALQVGADGELQTTEGYELSGSLRVPADATRIAISETGEVMVTVPDDAAPVSVGQLELARFLNPEGLEAMGQGLFRSTDASGQAFYSEPGLDGTGLVKQGFLEASNVDLVDELTELLLAQRAYQLNAKVIQAADEILAEVGNLRR